MKPDCTEFAVAYIATGACGNVHSLNEATYNATQTVNYLAEHDIIICETTVYSFQDAKSYPIDGPVIELTRKAKELVAALKGPVEWLLVVQRQGERKTRGSYSTRARRQTMRHKAFTSAAD